jgi:hypothetical protein
MTNDPNATPRTDAFWMLWRQARLSEIDALERELEISPRTAELRKELKLLRRRLAATEREENAT